MAEEKKSVEATVQSIRRATRKKCTAEEKVRIVPEGLRGENSIVELRHRERILVVRQTTGNSAITEPRVLIKEQGKLCWFDEPFCFC